MKKKLSRKLSLSKKTVINLDHGTMGKVRGGYITASCPEPDSWCNTRVNCTAGCPSVVPWYC